MLRYATIRVSRNYRASRALCSGVPVKEPPIVGLAAGPDSRETISAVESIPPDAAYRVNVEKITRYRLDVIRSETDIDAIEDKLGVGQIGEIIEMAQDELDLIPHMAEWQPWKTADGAASVKIELID